MPKARTCYICGRPTLLPGYDQHVAQCKALFEKREMTKPPKERRQCPRDPMEFMGGRGCGLSLDAFNDAATKSWEQSLLPCRYCGRTFLPEKLAIHNKSCTASNPARRVGGNNIETRDLSYFGEDDDKPSPRVRVGLTTEKSEGTFGYDRATGTKPQYRKAAVEDDYIRSSKGGGGPKFDDFPTYGHLIKCKDCGRNFNEVSFPKHAKVCRKVFLQKRKPFDSAKARAKGTELAAFQSSKRRNSSTIGKASSTNSSYQQTTPRTGKQTGGLPKWKEQSLAFRQAVRQARVVSRVEQQAKASGIPLHKLLPPPGSSFGNDFSGPPSDYIQCPTCGRSFSQKAGERHIPQCRNIINKPKRLERGSGHMAVTNASYSSPMAEAPTRSRFDDSFGSTNLRRNSGRMIEPPLPIATSSQKYGVNEPVRPSRTQYRR